MAALICVMLEAIGDGARLGSSGIDPKGGGGRGLSCRGKEGNTPGAKWFQAPPGQQRQLVAQLEVRQQLHSCLPLYTILRNQALLR